MNPAKDAAWDIRIERLEGGYGSRRIIKGMDATFPGGAITAILGESGGGKTTLLRILLGLTPPFSGRIFMGGRDIFVGDGGDLPACHVIGQAVFIKVRNER